MFVHYKIIHSYPGAGRGILDKRSEGQEDAFLMIPRRRSTSAKCESAPHDITWHHMRSGPEGKHDSPLFYKEAGISFCSSRKK